MRGLVLGSLLGTALLALGPGFGQGPVRNGGGGWLADLEAGKARARATGRPLLVVFRCEP